MAVMMGAPSVAAKAGRWVVPSAVSSVGSTAVPSAE